MRARTALIVGALVALTMAPTALSHDGPSIETVAPPSEECPSGKSLCLELVTQPPTLQPGDVVDLVFFNDDDRSHTIMVTTGDQADGSHSDTSRNAALAFTPEVPAGGSSSENTFTVPEGVSMLYIWCDVSGHESSGMWLEVPVQGGEEANGSPAPAWAAIAGLVLAGLAVARRRKA